jgi:hypothetical protein
VLFVHEDFAERFEDMGSVWVESHCGVKEWQEVRLRQRGKCLTVKSLAPLTVEEMIGESGA